jgi:hypothetical protein
MQITHEEARELIQFNTDHALNVDKREMLHRHLKECEECMNYVREMEAVEATLKSTLRAHWCIRPVHLDVRAVKAKLNPIRAISSQAATRAALIGVTVMLFVLASWQLVSISNPTGSLTANVLPIPTPSLLLTGTNNHFNNCKEVQYKVRKGDTLESIAREFSTSKQILIELNQLPSENLNPITILMIPLCDPTPTGTVHPPALTTTPMFETTTYTPG